jgi:DNA-binding GntR family transcriptional regulator
VTALSRPADGYARLLQEPPLRERVRQRLEELIVDGTYPVGAHLVETDIAVRLGVSRGPIREALYQMSLNGWIDLRPRQGAFVHRPALEEVLQFFSVRELLECEAARLAAADPSPAIIDLMRTEIKNAKLALKAGDRSALVTANGVFHGYVYQLANNAVLQDLARQLTLKLSWYFWPMAMERPADAWAEHQQLVDAIEQRDASLAVKTMRAHIRATRDLYANSHEQQRSGTESVANA